MSEVKVKVSFGHTVQYHTQGGYKLAAAGELVSLPEAEAFNLISAGAVTRVDPPAQAEAPAPDTSKKAR